jgi:CheY-like chemotaxis protein
MDTAPKIKRKILMIEDDIFLRKLYRDQLVSAGYDFVEATNGKEGVGKVLVEKPDMILLDLMLPLMNGFDVLAEIKNNPITKHIPVIVLSNLSQDTDKEAARDLGADAYLVKSEVSMSDVVGKIESLMNA